MRGVFGELLRKLKCLFTGHNWVAYERGQYIIRGDGVMTYTTELRGCARCGLDEVGDRTVVRFGELRWTKK